MTNIEFGRLIEKLIYFSGQKNYSLAKALGYDVSYISKWISGSMLPAAKNIKIINEKIANFAIQNSTESSIDDMITYFKVGMSHGGDRKEALSDYIEEALNQAYLYSNNKSSNVYSSSKNQKKIYKNQDIDYNGSIHINPKFIKKHLDDDIMEFIGGDDINDIIILANLFSLNREDKLHLAGITRGESLKYEMRNARTRFLISFDENIEDIIFDTILFINMIIAYSHVDFNLYSCKHSACSLIVTIKDKLFHNALYTDTHKCLFTNTSKEENIVEEMYNSLEEMINTSSRLTFLDKTPKSMILDKNYMQYIIGHDLKWVMGNINELFMPSDLFLEIGKTVFGDSKEVTEELKKIDAILQNATYNADLKVLMYESGIRNYVSTGRLSFFNIPITVTLEQRQRHIEYMEKLFKEQENIDIKLIDGNLVENFKHNRNPSLYISKNLTFIRVDDNENIIENNKYLLVRDGRLDNIFKSFFNEVWNNKEDNITRNRDDIIERISDSLNYIRILNSSIND